MTLLHRRADLRETMADYLIRDLDRAGVAVRDRSELAELHGEDGKLEGVTLRSGERLPISYLFAFLGALPCTAWLDNAVRRCEQGFVLTGPAADAEYLLETSEPGIFAAGDVRAGSTSAARRPSAKARWPCSSSTRAWRHWRSSRRGLNALRRLRRVAEP